MSRRISLKWCKRCTKPSCEEDEEIGCPFKNSVEEYKESISKATTPEETKNIQERWREVEEPLIRKCLTRRYFVWLKYCRMGVEESAQQLFDVPCDPKYYFFPEKRKKTRA